MKNQNEPLTMILLSLFIIIINFPVVDFIRKLKASNCKCAKIWNLNYLYIYLLFWYTFSAIEILLWFLAPGIINWFNLSIFYYPTVVISGVSYTFYIMILWSYVEYLKESKCDCSHIKQHKYLTTYSWFFFLLYVVSASYIGTIIGGFKPDK